MNKKRGELNLSFGMIFSIILIIVFIVFAFYAIGKFFSFQDEIKLRQFYEVLEKDIDKAWKSTKALETNQYVIPKYIQKICFNSSKISIYKTKEDKLDIGGHEFSHLNTQDGCLYPLYGKINFTLEKNYGESLVRLKT